MLKAGEWSDWIPVSFRMAPLHSLHGMCRIFLRQVQPDFELYVSPINIDPAAPALTISSPSAICPRARGRDGPFLHPGHARGHQGLHGWCPRHRRVPASGVDHRAENRRQFRYLLDRFRGGLFFHYFGHVDQVSHVMWRTLDPAHPAYVASRDEQYRGVIEDLYAGLDAIVGEALRRCRPAPADRDVGPRLHVVAAVLQSEPVARRGRIPRAENPSRRGDGSAPGHRLDAHACLRPRPERALSQRQRPRAVRDRGGVRSRTRSPRSSAPCWRSSIPSRAPGPSPPSSVRRGAIIRCAHPDRTPDLIVGYAKGTRTVERLGPRRRAARRHGGQPRSLERRSLHGSRCCSRRAVVESSVANQGDIASGCVRRHRCGVRSLRAVTHVVRSFEVRLEARPTKSESGEEAACLAQIA